MLEPTPQLAHEGGTHHHGIVHHPSAQPGPEFFFLYLSWDTFVGEAGVKLAEEVRIAKAAGLSFVLAHENDETKAGCEFDR